jgi:hypothetical protein
MASLPNLVIFAIFGKLIFAWSWHFETLEKLGLAAWLNLFFI